MWASMLVLFAVHHFASNPTHMRHGFCSNNCPTHKGWNYLFPTHTLQTKTIGTIKITNSKNNIEKTKREKENQQKKIEINKIFKNYLKFS
jgi:hypothetical protein